MLEIQQTRDDCFAVCVACITELPQDEVLDIIPTMIPKDIWGVWDDWGYFHDRMFRLHTEDPGGLCIANLHVIADDILEQYTGEWLEADFILHAVVWDNGILWNPSPTVFVEDLGEPHSFVTIERI